MVLIGQLYRVDIDLTAVGAHDLVHLAEHLGRGHQVCELKLRLMVDGVRVPCADSIQIMISIHKAKEQRKQTVTYRVQTYRSRRGLGAEPLPSLTVLPSSFLLIGLIMDSGKKPPSSSAQYAPSWMPW